MFSRRNFLKTSALTGAALTLNESISAFAHSKKEKIRIGIIGSGLRSQEHIGNFCQRFRSGVGIAAG